MTWRVGGSIHHGRRRRGRRQYHRRRHPGRWQHFRRPRRHSDERQHGRHGRSSRHPDARSQRRQSRWQCLRQWQWRCGCRWRRWSEHRPRFGYRSASCLRSGYPTGRTGCPASGAGAERLRSHIVNGTPGHRALGLDEQLQSAVAALLPRQRRIRRRIARIPRPASALSLALLGSHSHTYKCTPSLSLAKV